MKVKTLGMVLLLLLSVGCKKTAKAGDSCDKDGLTYCKDKKTAVICVDGKFEELACRTGAGCTQVGIGDGHCNNHKFEVGEPCFDSGEYKCTPDGKSMLMCEEKRYKLVEKCLGQNGCVANAKGAKCDMSISEEGAPCTKDNTFACTADGKKMLRCDGKKLSAHALCPGRHGCRKQFKNIQCNGEKLIK